MLSTEPQPVATPLDAHRFERLLSEISTRFIQLTPASADTDFLASLRAIVEAFGIDRSSLTQLVDDEGHFRTRHSYAASGVVPVPPTTSSRVYPWALSMAKAGRPIVFDRLDDLPPEAHVDKASYRGIGMKSHIGQPIVVAGELFGVLGFGCVRAERAWSPDDLQRTRLLTDMFANVLARLRRQKDLDLAAGFERVASRLLASLLIAGPEAEDEAIDNGLADIGTFLGVDRVVLWERVGATPEFHSRYRWAAAGVPNAAVTVGPAQAPWTTARLVAGAATRLSREAELPVEAAADLPLLRGFRVRSLLAIPISLGDSVVGAFSVASVREEREWPDGVVAGVGLLGQVFASLRARRQAELNRRAAEAQAEQARAALAHVTRVSMLSQLSASIAHQLNQPLAAILGNAEAARAMLSQNRIDRAELREICDEIITEDNRAADIIRRLGALYRRGEMTRASFDLNALVRETLGLLQTELVGRQVTAVADLDPSLPLIEGGRVQLQQVLLNLVLNAAEAMSPPGRFRGESPGAQRVLTVRTEAAGAGVRLSVTDRGPGIAPGDLDSIFEAYWSTKPGGMGIGLAICKSIIAAHRGTLTAGNTAEGGATFCATLPVRTPS